MHLDPTLSSFYNALEYKTTNRVSCFRLASDTITVRASADLDHG
jgi:hypothetical protein